MTQLDDIEVLVRGNEIWTDIVEHNFDKVMCSLWLKPFLCKLGWMRGPQKYAQSAMNIYYANLY